VECCDVIAADGGKREDEGASVLTTFTCSANLITAVLLGHSFGTEHPCEGKLHPAWKAVLASIRRKKRPP